MASTRRKTTLALVAAICSWLLAATVALSAQQPAAESTNRVVAIGDIHGDFDAFVSILRQTGLVDTRHRWIGGAATLVQTGDFRARSFKLSGPHDETRHSKASGQTA